MFVIFYYYFSLFLEFLLFLSLVQAVGVSLVACILSIGNYLEGRSNNGAYIKQYPPECNLDNHPSYLLILNNNTNDNLKVFFKYFFGFIT